MSITAWRRITQAFMLLLIAAIPVLNKKGITVIIGSLYSLAVGPLMITDPLSGFQVIITTLALDRVLLFSLLLPLIIALVFGRVFCGWLCPQNALSEFFDFLKGKLKIKRLFHPPLSAKWRYGVLLVMLGLTVGLRFPAANLISAPGIISVQVTRFVYEGRVGPEAILIALIITAEFFFARRIWCNYVCPVGGFLGMLRFSKTMRVEYREDADHVCGRCFECVKACGLGLDPMGEKIYPLCHNCGDCIRACDGMKGRGKPLSFRVW